MSAESLDALRARIHDDAALARQLAAVEDAHFTAAVLRLANDAALDVTADDVARAIETRRREWMLRWIR